MASDCGNVRVDAGEDSGVSTVPESDWKHPVASVRGPTAAALIKRAITAAAAAARGPLVPDCSLSVTFATTRGTPPVCSALERWASHGGD